MAFILEVISSCCLCSEGASGRVGEDRKARLATRAAVAKVNMFIPGRMEWGERIGGGFVAGNTLSGGSGARRHDWRRRSFGKVYLARKCNSLASLNSETSGSKQENKEHGKNRDEQSGGDDSSDEDDVELENGYKMSRVCDRLIEVFMTEKTSHEEWRNLLAYSKEWIEIRSHFFKRCSRNARAETDSQKRRALTMMAKQVKEVDKSMIRNDELVAHIERNELEIDAIVAKRRKDFTGEFFEHLRVLSDATHTQRRRDEIAALAGKCLSAIKAHDAALEDGDALHEAQIKFDEILNSPSLEAASKKIDQLARAKELDSTLLLLITKAWAAAKESTTMKDEVKEIMLHLYNTARGSMKKLAPDEIGIIKHLLSIEDPRERFAAMTQSFSPGDDLESKNKDMAHTTPDKLRKWIKLVLDSYHMNKQTTEIKEAKRLPNPEVISRLEMLMDYLEDQFM